MARVPASRIRPWSGGAICPPSRSRSDQGISATRRAGVRRSGMGSGFSHRRPVAPAAGRRGSTSPMWNGSFAAEAAKLELAAQPDRLTQLTRLLRLLLHIARVWTSAVFTVCRIDRGALSRLRRRHARRLLSVLGFEMVIRANRRATTTPSCWSRTTSPGSIRGRSTVSAQHASVAKSEIESWPIVGTVQSALAACSSPAVAGLVQRRSRTRRRTRCAAAIRWLCSRSRRARMAPRSCTSMPRSFRRRSTPMRWFSRRDSVINHRRHHTDAAAFIGDMTIADSLRRILRLRTIVVELTFCSPLPQPYTGAATGGLRARTHCSVVAAAGPDDASIPVARGIVPQPPRRLRRWRAAAWR